MRGTKIPNASLPGDKPPDVLGGFFIFRLLMPTLRVRLEVIMSGASG